MIQKYSPELKYQIEVIILINAKVETIAIRLLQSFPDLESLIKIFLSPPAGAVRASSLSFKYAREYYKPICLPNPNY